MAEPTSDPHWISKIFMSFLLVGFFPILLVVMLMDKTVYRDFTLTELYHMIAGNKTEKEIRDGKSS